MATALLAKMAKPSQLGGAFYEGLRAGGVVPVIKHLGHGRAEVDSHHALPVVDTDLDTLDGH